MKKWIFLVCTVLFVAVFCFYLLIPSDLTVTRMVPASCMADVGFRMFAQQKNWARWWPGEKDSLVRGKESLLGNKDSLAGDQDGFEYKGLAYDITKASYQVVNVRIRKEGGKGGDNDGGKEGDNDGGKGGGDDGGGYESRLAAIPVGKLDSMYLQWECPLHGGLNPFKRFRQYVLARQIARNMSEILDSLSRFLGRKENIYGAAIRRGTTMDSTLVTTRAVFAGYPSTNDIYGLLNRLKDYIKAEGAVQIDSPMMHAELLPNGKDSFQVMVAIPIDRKLSGKGPIDLKRLAPGTPFLIVDVEGGPYTVNHALKGLQQYILDYQKTVMAIPFESLLTDRLQEPDTSKWKTRIYCPIFYE
jgi:hypothetical protein